VGVLLVLRPRLGRLFLGAALGVSAVASGALAGEAQLGEEPAPTEVRDVKDGFEKKGVERGIPWLAQTRQALVPGWLEGSRLDLHFRTYYLNHAEDSDDPLVPENDRAAWAYGGWLRWESPWWGDRVNLAAAYYTSQRIWGPKRLAGSRLLTDEQGGYSVLGLANVKVRHGEVAQLTLYRQLLDIPFLNRQDNRMTPNTFEAATLAGRFRGFEYSLGWVERIKPRDSRRFINMAEAAGAFGEDRGLGYVALNWSRGESFTIGFTNQLTPDVINSFYAETGWTRELANGIGLRLEAQVTDQRSVGDELLTGSDFHTWRVGIRGTVSWEAVAITLAYSWTDDERAIVSPYGSDPSYLSTMQDDFEKAGDRGLLIGLSHNFARWDLPNLTAAFKVVFGRNRLGTAGGPGVEDRQVEATFDYHIAEGRLRGLWFRLRGSYLDDGPLKAGEVRAIINYDIPLF
jgi:hypothetical protein